ncbi:MFS transporter [Anaerotalea alkaliphila]|uniref:MFS transporter n=1 Tax=Anaerotalea alkaliphila TaxID=2662126 RepID=A0A7X5KNY6_9FIRM|nr:MFS transporter [Anaerotalea alkaliphila]NDL67247.1 MFS transporter [Anaerotalea alkaliphila]
MAPEKLWNRQYIAINLLVFACFLTQNILITTVPLYAVEIGGTPSTAGAFMSVISLTALVLRPVLGNLMDVRSRRLVLVLGASTLALVAFLFGFTATLALLLGLGVLMGLGVSALSTATPTVVADVTPPSRLAEGISLYGVATNLTMAAGPFLAFLLMKSHGFSATFLTASGIALLGLALTRLVDYEKRRKKPVRPPSSGALFERTVLRPSLYQACMAFGLAVVITFLPIYGASRGIPDIGLFYTFFAAGTVTVSFFTGKMVQKHGARRVFLPALAFQAAGFLLLATARSLPQVLAAAVLYGLGNGAGFAVVRIMGMQAAPPERRGAANATMFASMDVGIALGALLLGQVSTRFGFGAAFTLGAAVVLLDGVLFCLLDPSEKPSGKIALEGPQA